MKFTITLHPVSLLVGAAALGGVLWLASAAQSRPTVTDAERARHLRESARLIDQTLGGAYPGGLVHIGEGTPYVVPQRMDFVPIGFGYRVMNDANMYDYTTLRIDGKVEFFAPEPDGSHPRGTLSAPEVPFGVTIKSGSTVSVETWRGGIGYAYGKLIPQ